MSSFITVVLIAVVLTVVAGLFVAPAYRAFRARHPHIGE